MSPLYRLIALGSVGSTLAFGCLLGFGSGLALGVASPAAAQSLTADQWREDLAFVASSIRDQHPNPFHAVREGVFQKRVEALEDRIPELSDHQIIIEIASLVALLRDGHTKIEGGFQFLSGQLPLRLYSFADGIFVRAAPVALRGALGARLVNLGNTVAEDAYRRVAAAVSYDNEMTLMNRVPDSMMIPEVLHALGITSERERARFVLLDGQGREFILDLAPVPFDATLDWVELPLGDARPLYLRSPDTNYWHEYLEGSGTLYVQYNRVRDASDESIADYFGRLAQLVADRSPRRIVLDVRFNSGGNDYLNAPVVEWAESSLPLVGGSFYLVIGRGTYSAGQKLVTHLEATTNAVLVGEPSGGSPNHFGDAVRLQLPHSDLTLKVSSLFHDDAPGDERLASVPDIWAPPSSEAFFAGRDPALEAILSTETPGVPLDPPQ